MAMLAMLSGVVGRRVTIRPKRRDDWAVVPNLWAMIVGRPGIMKSPALDEVLRPLRAIQARAMEDYRAAVADFDAAGMVREQGKQVAKQSIRTALKRGDKNEAHELAVHAAY